MLNRNDFRYAGAQVGAAICGALIISASTLVLAGAAVAADKPAASAPAAKITEEQAKEIALKALPGKVTKVVIEKKKGKTVYAVEIMSAKQGEKDVLVDVMTGKVVGID